MDARSKVEKLLAMATQDASPEERDVAIAKLETMGMWPPPPNRPTAVSAGPPDWVQWTVSTVNTTTGSFSFEVRWGPKG